MPIHCIKQRTCKNYVKDILATSHDSQMYIDAFPCELS